MEPASCPGHWPSCCCPKGCPYCCVSPNGWPYCCGASAACRAHCVTSCWSASCGRIVASWGVSTCSRSCGGMPPTCEPKGGCPSDWPKGCPNCWPKSCCPNGVPKGCCPNGVPKGCCCPNGVPKGCCCPNGCPKGCPMPSCPP